MFFVKGEWSVYQIKLNKRSLYVTDFGSPEASSERENAYHKHE